MNESKAHKILREFLSRPHSDSVKNAFWHWLVSGNREEEKDCALNGLWDETEKGMSLDSVRSLNQVINRLKRQTVRNVWWKNMSRIAAMIAIPVLMVMAFSYFYYHSDQNQMIECMVPTGQRKIISLPDGTKVMVNSETFLIYPKTFKGKTRTVYLSGEANFDVHKDPKHPFIVQAGQFSVQALGTKFNVQSYRDIGKMVATLERGCIQITNLLDSSQVFVLKPNEQLSYNYMTRDFSRKKLDADIASCWTRGELNFVDCPMREMLVAIGRFYKVRINTSPKISISDLYTIKFKKGESFRNVIQLLELTSGNIKADFVKDDEVNLSLLRLNARKGGEK
mgnify:CR=1 FL=1